MHRSTSAVAVTVLFCATSLASAALIENFDSYKNAAEFQAAWRPWSSNGSSMLFNPTGGVGGSAGVSGVATVNGTVRNARNLDSFTEYQPKPDHRVKFEYMIYDSDPASPLAPNGARNFNELRAYAGDGVPAYNGAGLQGLIALGMYNTPISDDNFHARIYYGGLNQWISLNTRRTLGWHKLTAMIGNADIQFYVDDRLDTTVPLIDTAKVYAFDGVMLGSGLTSGGFDVGFDNLMVTSMPEPMTLAGLAVGALLLRRRRGAAR